MERKRTGSVRPVRLHGRDVWRAQVTIDGETRSKVADTEEEARAWLAGIIAEHPTWEWTHHNAKPNGEGWAMEKRGSIFQVTVRGRQYWRAAYSVDGAKSRLFTRDRAEAERVAENPTYAAPHGTGRPKPAGPTAEPKPEPHIPVANPFAGAMVSVAETPSLWMVAAETNPNTSLMLMLKFGRRPARVLVTDIVEGTPIVWVADDNGGEGFGSETEARERMEAMRDATDPGVGLSVRPFSRKCRTSDNC